MAQNFKMFNAIRTIGRLTAWTDIQTQRMIPLLRVPVVNNYVGMIGMGVAQPSCHCWAPTYHSNTIHIQLPGSISFRRKLSTSNNLRASNSLPTSKVLYDGDCKICQIEISALKKWTKNRNNIEFIDISRPEYDPQLWGGVTYEDAMKEMHVVGPDGKVYTQGGAVRHMYRACGLGFLSTFTELPLVRQVCDELYVHFAKYRLKKALDRCDSNSCDIKLKYLRDKLEKENRRL